jgi:hypothetical protein
MSNKQVYNDSQKHERAGAHIGSGLAWMGFWLMIGLSNFGEEPAVNIYDQTVKAVQDVINNPDTNH